MQCKCYVNICWYMANSSLAFWNFLGLKKKIFFCPWLVESMIVEHMNMGGHLYSVTCVVIKSLNFKQAYHSASRVMASYSQHVSFQIIIWMALY